MSTLKAESIHGPVKSIIAAKDWAPVERMETHLGSDLRYAGHTVTVINQTKMPGVEIHYSPSWQAFRFAKKGIPPIFCPQTNFRFWEFKENDPTQAD